MTARGALSFDDLPRYSPWPARLLADSPWPQRTKTREEVLREFEREKWGPLLARLTETPRKTSLDEFEASLVDSPAELLTLDHNHWLLLRPDAARARYVAHVTSFLARYADGPAVLELGCGYGSVLLRVAQHPAFRGKEILGGELTTSGLALLRKLAENESVAVTAGPCDLEADPITSLAPRAGSLVYTSYAAHYTPTLDLGFVHRLCALRPATVVHFEPCYEHAAEHNVLGLLRRRYIEVNDYNRNLRTVLHEAQTHGLIRILTEEPAFFGANPLLAASAIAWSPAA